MIISAHEEAVLSHFLNTFEHVLRVYVPAKLAEPALPCSVPRAEESILSMSNLSLFHSAMMLSNNPTFGDAILR